MGPAKGHGLVAKSVALLTVPRVTQVACQHWAGVFCFAAGFRRPLFAVAEQIFAFIVKLDDRKGALEVLPNEVRDEVLVAGLLTPLAFSNLRAPLRPIISCSDASEQGGAAAEASRFVSAVDEVAE